MSPATAKRSEDRLRVIEVSADGDIKLELTHRGRVYTTTIAGDDSVTMIEAAALCGCSRSTVYNWTQSASYYAPKALPAKDGRVELPDLRRYLNALGQWWLTDHPPAQRIAACGPVREVVGR